MLVLGLLTAWLQGQPLFGVVQGARSNWLLVSLVLLAGLTPIIMWLLVPRRRQRLAAVEDALARGTMTSELRAALGDQVVIGSRRVELLAVAVILVLMILKPF